MISSVKGSSPYGKRDGKDHKESGSNGNLCCEHTGQEFYSEWKSAWRRPALGMVETVIKEISIMENPKGFAGKTNDPTPGRSGKEPVKYYRSHRALRAPGTDPALRLRSSPRSNLGSKRRRFKSKGNSSTPWPRLRAAAGRIPLPSVGIAAAPPGFHPAF